MKIKTEKGYFIKKFENLKYNMQWNKKQIITMLEFYDEDKEFILYELPLSKINRSKAQNNAFYLAFTTISKKMWLSLEEVKMNCLKALFGTSKTKFGWVEYENALKPKSSDLSIEEATLLIETLIEFWKKLWCGEIISSREYNSLFNYEEWHDKIRNYNI